MSSARSVAKELVGLAQREPLPDLLTYYRLHCLVYYAQAWSLVMRGSELFPDDIEALDEGPAIPTMLDGEGEPAWQQFEPGVFDKAPPLDDEDEAVFLRHLWKAYGHLSPSGLFALIQEDPPFLKAKRERERQGSGQIGTTELCESFSRRSGVPPALDEYHRLRRNLEKDAELAILSSPPLDIKAIWKDCRSLTPSARKQ